MASCRNCGSYTKYNNGLCYSCYKKNKSGYVYVAESTRKNGAKKYYVGKTQREPKTRWGEHMSEVKKPQSKTWAGRGTNFKPLGAIWSSNVSKAERTVKSMSPAQKKAFGNEGARRYKKKKGFLSWLLD